MTIETQNESIPEIQLEEVSLLQDALNELDMHDRNSIIMFGSSAQKKLDEISNRMIEGVQKKDIAEASTSLNEMLTSIRSFDLEKFNPNQKHTWWQKIFTPSKPLVKFIQSYEEVRHKIDSISYNLETHKSQLMKDIVALDKLYDANLNYFRNLELYIKAGETKQETLQTDTIPHYQSLASSKELIAIQNLQEIEEFNDELERRIHDLRLSRQVTMHALPSIRLIQKNDKALISKINSTLVNTVPLWKSQLAQTITLFRSVETANAVKDAANLTNELLEKNAQGLKEVNAQVGTQMERGIFDIQSIKKANEIFIDTLNESLDIVKVGRNSRKEAFIELNTIEQTLKDALLAHKSN